MAIRILIADDHRLLRAGLHNLLQADENFEVVGEATSGDEALQLAAELKPDIVLMDISMPGANGPETTRQLIEANPETKVVMLTMHEDSALLQGFLRAGASGYITKRAAESELVDAIYAVKRGMVYIHPTMVQKLVTQQQAPPPAPPSEEPLTAREIDILRFVVRGHTNRQIASALSISVRTVETHRSNLMDKLNLHSRVELFRYASEHNLVNPDDGP